MCSAAGAQERSEAERVEAFGKRRRSVFPGVLGSALVAMAVCFLAVGCRHFPGGSAAGPEHEPADNSFCDVCHLNFKAEEFAVAHWAAGVGCGTCHGESYAHSSDEDHVIPPDVMYAKVGINASCMTADCHSGKQLAAESEHKSVLAGADGKKEVCTDCHGEHQIAKRQRRWNKETGKLIWRDGHDVN